VTSDHRLPDDSLRKVHIETDIEAYRYLLSDDWGERVFALTEIAPKLSTLIFDLMIGWRAAAYTASLPVSIVEHLKSFHDSYVNSGEINTTLLRIMPATMQKLVPRVPELTGDPELVRKLQKAIADIGTEIEEARGNTKIEFPFEETWQDYLTNHVFQLSLWGSQQIAFVSIYNSYDNFVAQLVGIALSLDEYPRTAGKKFKKHFCDAFGEQLKEKCWTKHELQVVREVRHALSHAGGRVTTELDAHRPKHDFIVVEERLQVTPDKTKALFVLLKDCVYSLSEAAVKMNQFK
jgi:hypothetical protein